MDLRFGAYRLKRRDRQLIGPHGPLAIKARAFDILEALLRQPNATIGKDALFDAVWPGVTVEENTLQVHVSALRKLLGAAMIVTVHGRGYKYAGPPPVEVKPESGTPSERQAALGRKPVIAVLPFANLSGDPDQRYFSDGVTEDIVSRLSKYRVLSVVGWHSSFALRGREESLGEVREKLAADYALTGSIRRSAGRIRVAARLTDTAAASVLWADHYDRPLEDVFAVQDEVAGIIVSTLLGRVEVAAATRDSAAGTPVISSYEHVLKGAWHFKQLTRPACAIAAHCFAEAIEAFPGNAEAHRWLAICENCKWSFDFDREGLVRSLALAEQAIELDPMNAGGHAVRGFAQIWLCGIGAARPNYRRALALNPDDPHVLAEAGLLEVYAGDLAANRGFFDRAFALDPLPPAWYAEFVAVGHFADGRYAEALPAFLAVPDGAWEAMYALACMGLLGDLAQARQLRKGLQDRRFVWNFRVAAAAEPYTDPEPRQRLLAGLGEALAD
jgi:TolB-like protein